MAAFLDNDICHEKYLGHTQFMTCFKKCNYRVGDTIHFRISQIYDLSKFWIVTKYRELEVFEKYLFKYYYFSKQKYKIPSGGIEVNMYCIVCTDGGYYRGIVVGLPIDYQEKPKVQVFFYDYGMVKIVEEKDVFYISRNHLEVPQFVVRAALAGIAPKKHPEWTVEDVSEFGTLVYDKILIGKVLSVDSERQVMDISCALFDNDVGTPLNEIFIKQGRARLLHEKPQHEKNLSSLEPKLEFPYLFPCHEAIESGKVCTNMGDALYQMQISPYSTLVSRYYKNVDGEN